MPPAQAPQGDVPGCSRNAQYRPGRSEFVGRGGPGGIAWLVLRMPGPGDNSTSVMIAHKAADGRIMDGCIIR